MESVDRGTGDCQSLRIGQDSPVTVVKYITEGTVEKTIAALQKRKSRLAKLTPDKGDGKDWEGLMMLEDLMFVLDTNSG
ncbi:hypothetical protein GGR54DRAFT_638345 [Hypoxylon sp. NC1633]|nr:hypothetical protein GGR54DRAFT_638345 [Hypoxylon sp. NC1633]